jgi:hypothetical protein
MISNFIKMEFYQKDRIATTPQVPALKSASAGVPW